MRQRLWQWRLAFYITAIIVLVIYAWQIVGGYFSRINILSSLSPLFIGLGIAYTIWPVIGLLERIRVPRWMSLIVVYIALGALITWCTNMIIPILITNFNDLARTLPVFANDVMDWVNTLPFDYSVIDIDSMLATVIDRGLSIATQLSSTVAVNLVSMLTNSFSFLMNIVLGIFISIYLIIDKDLIMNSFYSLCPKRYRERAKEYVQIIDSVLSSYLRGLIIMIFILGIMTYVALTILDVRYALIAAIITGVLKVVPIVGAWAGLIPVALFALIDSPTKALVACIVYFVVQQLDGSIISPRVMGKEVGVHPVFVIVGIFVFGKMFGITGMLLAVPVMGIAKLIYVKIRAAYNASRYTPPVDPNFE